MSTPLTWEKRCRRCGRCCYEKYDIEGRIYYSDVPCEFLDLHTRLCKVYGQRQRRKPGCVAITPRICASGVLPADCPYVAEQDDYVPPILFGEDGD